MRTSHLLPKSRRRLLAMTVAVLVVLTSLSVVLPESLGMMSERDLLRGAFPSRLTAQGGVIHARMVTHRSDVEGSASQDLWIDVSVGDFLVVEWQDSDVISVAACDGTWFKKYEVSGHRACDFTVAAVMSAEPEAVTGPRDTLETLSLWAADMAKQAGGAGESTTVRGRSAVLYTDIGQGGSGSEIAQGSELDLLVDATTGLPLQAEVHRRDSSLLSRTVYHYEVTETPVGGFTLSFPKGYYIQTDKDLGTSEDENVSVQGLVRSVGHALYWAGAELDARPLNGCRVGESGVVTLQYGAHSGGTNGLGKSPLVSVYEYVASALTPETLSNIEGQLQNPEEVEGARGTYTLYDTALNGMPVLEVVLGDVHVLIADVEDGDVDVMVRTADALVRVAD